MLGFLTSADWLNIHRVRPICALGLLPCPAGQPVARNWVARACSVQDALGGVSPVPQGSDSRRGRWKPRPSHPLPSPGSLLGGGGRGALCWLPRARTPDSARAVYAPVRAPRASSPALGAAFTATVCSPGPSPLPPPPGRGLCPLGRSLQSRRTSSKKMLGPVSTAAAAGRAGSERGRKIVPGMSPSPRAALSPGPGRRPGPGPGAVGRPSPSQHWREEGRESASELGSLSGARAATSSLGNRCHSNGVALPGNATAG